MPARIIILKILATTRNLKISRALNFGKPERKFNMAKIPEAQNRLFKNVFVCKNCHSKIRSDPQKILKGKAKCRKCGKKAFRPLKKK